MNSAIEPVPKDAAWMKRHEDFVREAKSGNIDILFIGDSLTDWWREPDKGGSVWHEHFANRRAANFGISADRTQHVLWRLQNGEGEGYVPKTVVLLIGTNNTGLENNGTTPRNTPAEAIGGIRAVLGEIRRRFPNARILWHMLFPRGEVLNRQQIDEINSALRETAIDENIVLVDIGHQFLTEAGNVNDALMPDLLHLNEAGYRVWAASLTQALDSLSQPTF